MPWNPSLKLEDCRKIAKKWNKDTVIIIALNSDDGKIEMATYGKTKELCVQAKRLGGKAFDAIVSDLASPSFV